MQNLLKLITILSLALFSSALVNQTSSKVAPGLNLTQGNFTYGCGGWSFYAGYDYYSSNAKRRASLVQNFQADGVYGLEGGAAFEIRGGQLISLNESSAAVPSLIICAKSGGYQRIISKGSECPEDYFYMPMAYESAIASPADATCQSPGINETVRFGYRGSITNNNGRCEVKYWDEREIKKTICINGDYMNHYWWTSKAVIAVSDKQCREGQSLLTVREVHANLDHYCQQIQSTGAVRLAGGAAIFPNEGKCEIWNFFPYKLSHGLCADATRTL